MFSYNGTTAPTHRELVEIYRAELLARIADGETKPIILPYFGFSTLILIGYLCIPHVKRPWLYAARWPVMSVIAALNFKIMAETRTMAVGTGFGVGLVAAWIIVLSMTWLIWNAPQFEAKRVELKKKSGSKIASGGEDVKSVSKGKASKTDEGLKQRQLQNGHTKAGELIINGNGKLAPPEYYWQPYPNDSIRDRIDWVVDLVINFRGPGWNWEVPSNPPLPPFVKAGLGESVSIKSLTNESPAGIRRFYTRRQLFRRTVPRFIIGYLLLDLMKVILMKDTYFILGPTSYPPPAYVSSLSPTLLSAYRQLATMAGIIAALETIFATAPLTLCLALGPLLGLRGEPWMYASTWGFLSTISTQGLQGFWGSWWHQTFRFAFSAPSAYLIRHNLIRPNSAVAKLLSLTLAFATSSFLHAAGSYTQLPPTRILNPVYFFMLQAVGIMIQNVFCQVFRKQIKAAGADMRSSANVAFVGTWLYMTAPLLVDDFARGGLWLYQPVPVSLFRGLGFGEKGDGWWCWDQVDWWPWFEGRNIWERGPAW